MTNGVGNDVLIGGRDIQMNIYVCTVPKEKGVFLTQCFFNDVTYWIFSVQNLHRLLGIKCHSSNIKRQVGNES